MAISDIFHTSSRSVFSQDTGINNSSNNNNNNEGDSQQTTQSTTSGMIETAATTTNISGGGGSPAYTAATGAIQLFHLLLLATPSLITLCAAGGWVRYKLLATPQFVRHRSSNLVARNCLNSQIQHSREHGMTRYKDYLPKPNFLSRRYPHGPRSQQSSRAAGQGDGQCWCHPHISRKIKMSRDYDGGALLDRLCQCLISSAPQSSIRLRFTIDDVLGRQQQPQQLNNQRKALLQSIHAQD